MFGKTELHFDITGNIIINTINNIAIAVIIIRIGL
jgi:hypothetical protein